MTILLSVGDQQGKTLPHGVFVLTLRGLRQSRGDLGGTATVEVQEVVPVSWRTVGPSWGKKPGVSGAGSVPFMGELPFWLD